MSRAAMAGQLNDTFHICYSSKLKVMKKLIFSALLLAAFPLANFAGGMTGSNIPANVRAAFSEKYPNASIKHWKSEKTDFCVKFDRNSEKYEAFFAPNGTWERTERKISLTKDLPPLVRNGFRNSGYAACNIDAIREVQSPDSKLYVLRVDNGNYFDSNHHDNEVEGWVLYFSPEGQLVRSRPQQHLTEE